MTAVRWRELEFSVREAIADTELAALAIDILAAAVDAESVTEFLDAALAALSDVHACRSCQLVTADAGSWKVRAKLGSAAALPTNFLADVLDREAAGLNEKWLASTLDHRRQVQGLKPGDVLLLEAPSAPEESLHALSRLAPIFGRALSAARRRRAALRRNQQLAELLEIAHRWSQTREMETLLNDMAEASTRLLHSDRASIFLWDRASKTLVGRPALGVEGGELRIPDDKGIVGQVVQTGETRRVDRSRDQDQINRGVDKQLGYQTETLLCAPLVTRSGKIIGAFEMINKLEGEFSDEDATLLVELAAHAATALENTQQYEQLSKAQRQIAEQAAEGVRLIGDSPAIEALRSTIRRLAPTELAVLILGENGTGKEVASRMIHYLSDRRDQPFIAVNCAALAETLLESELFGHEKGAFTDAHEARPGKFEVASGGTLFLDEIGDLSLSGQAKLLRVLEDKVVVRVGGSRPIHTDARVVAATNQNLAAMVRERRFREDLYFRLNGVTLNLPPLRDRGDDILLLAENFLAEFSRQARRNPPAFSADAKRRLHAHSWPGNVRELRNLCERLAYLLPGDQVEADDLAFIMPPGEDGEVRSHIDFDLPLADATAEFQTEFIGHAIQRCSGNMSDAAKQLGLHRSNLYRKMRQLGMDSPE